MAQRRQEQQDQPQGNPSSRSFGQDTPWKCFYCNFMLGLVSPDQKILRVKYKDFYMSVQGGRVETLCRKCGRVNVLEYSPDEEQPAGTVGVVKNLRFTVAKAEPSIQRRSRR